MADITIIIPVYNKEKHLRKCLDSIFAQSFQDFSVIIINDGSTDGSQRILDECKSNHSNIEMYVQENMGVSYSRNFGISKVKSEYFTFIDADDYVKPDLLQTLNKAILSCPNLDVLSYSIIKVDVEFNEVLRNKKPCFESVSGETAMKNFILGATTYDTPVGYVYRKSYWDGHGFTYALDRYHEDFGLTPLVILNAKKMVSLDYFGYYNVLSEDSIMRTTDESKIIKKAYDFLYHFDVLSREVKLLDICKQMLDLFYVHIVHALIKKAMSLNKAAQNEYTKEIRKRKIYKFLPSDNIKRLVKKIAVKLGPKHYWRLYKMLMLFK